MAKLKNNLGNPDGGTSLSPQLRSVRVFDVILDNTHDSYTGEDSIGTIFYGDVELEVSSVDVNNLNRAIPYFPFLSYIPRYNEIVQVLETTSNRRYKKTKGNKAFTQVYYFPPANLWNSPHHNASPLEGSLNKSPNNEEAKVGIQQNSLINEVKLGEYYREQIVKRLQPFEGDLIIEGRNRQGFRFGSSNPKGKNNWSNNDKEGSPVTIIGNGYNQTSGDAIVEDINNTDSIIVMTSDTNVDNFAPASLNLKSLGADLKVTNKVQTLIDDTPDPTITTKAAEPEIEIENTTAEVIEEKISPSPAEELEPDVDDPIFDLLDEAVEEGFLQPIYGFEYLEPNYTAASISDEYEEWTPEDDGIFVNEIIEGNILPDQYVSSKVRVKPVYINNLRKWTKITANDLAFNINYSGVNYPQVIRTSIMSIALQEQPLDGQNAVGGYNYNHYGIMSDQGNWGKQFDFANGSVAATEGVGGQGIRTDDVRYFMSFPSERNGILFMAEALTRKNAPGNLLNGGTNMYTAADNWPDFYIDKWLSPSEATKQKEKSATGRAKYIDVFNKANNYIINNRV